MKTGRRKHLILADATFVEASKDGDRASRTQRLLASLDVVDKASKYQAAKAKKDANEANQFHRYAYRVNDASAHEAFGSKGLYDDPGRLSFEVSSENQGGIMILPRPILKTGCLEDY